MDHGPSPGWMLIGPGVTAAGRDLTAWIQQQLAFAATLPSERQPPLAPPPVAAGLLLHRRLGPRPG
jgi:hypothetical protein